MKQLVMGLSFMVLAGKAPAVSEVSWVSSSPDGNWKWMASPRIGKAALRVPKIRIDLRKKFQKIDGFGGCFNELGWSALGRASQTDRKQVLDALFSADGCAFNLARIPIGASDFALNGYSLDDTPNDYALDHFSLSRDRQALIPYVRAAMNVRPDLNCWASPWSPPAWMKTNGSYAGGELKWEPKILRSYADYIVRWVDGYRREGVRIYAVTPQNEPNIAGVYPTCIWTGDHLRDFIGTYLGPAIKAQKNPVELWLGLNGDPANDGENPNARLLTVLDDAKAKRALSGVAFQYDSRNQIQLAHELFPALKMMQSETACQAGANSWEDAQALYGNMRRYLASGANAYFMWNMVLDDTGLSSWNWRQNAMISVSKQSGAVTYNGEYYVMRHFSQFIKAKAHRVLTTGIWNDVIAFQNPDGSTVVVAGNSSANSHEVEMDLQTRTERQSLTVTLPAKSVNTFVIR